MVIIFLESFLRQPTGVDGFLKGLQEWSIPNAEVVRSVKLEGNCLTCLH